MNFQFVYHKLVTVIQILVLSCYCKIIFSDQIYHLFRLVRLLLKTTEYDCHCRYCFVYFGGKNKYDNCENMMQPISMKNISN